jgi:oligopeptide transport system substrate-binding protein
MIKRVLLFFSILVVLTLTSCQSGPKKHKSTLRVNISTDPATLDPRKGCDLNSATLHFLLYEGLVRQEPNKKDDLGIAKDISISDDGLTYTFTLRKAYWSNGTPITTYDFIQTFKDMLSPSFPCPNAHLLYCIKNAKKAKQGLISQRHIGIKGIDYRTLEITLESPTPYFLDILTFCNFSPVNQNIAQVNPLYAHTKHQPLVSNGPYTLVKYTPGQEMILEKNPYYWDKDNVSLDRMIISIIDNAQTTLNLFEKGLIDYIGLPFTQIPQEVIGQDKYKESIKCGNLPASTLLSFNLDSKIFKNENIRKAFCLSVDRKEVYYSILDRDEKCEGISYFSKNLEHTPKPYFPMTPQSQLARSYLKKGLEDLKLDMCDLKQLSLVHSNYGKYAHLAQILQEQWSKNLGVLIQLNTIEHKAFLSKLYAKDYDITLCCWIAQYLHKMNFFERFVHKDHNKNYPGYNSFEYNELISKLSSTNDLDQAHEIHQKLEELLVNSYCIIPIYHWNNQYMLSNNIESFESLPGGSMCYKRLKTSNRQSV